MAEGMVTDVGAIRAKMELDARGFNTDMEKVKQNMTDSASEAKRVNNDFKQITRSLRDLGLSGKDVQKVQQELRQIRPDVVEQQFKNLEVQLRRIGASDDHIAKIKTKLTEVRSGLVEVQDETKRSVNRFDSFQSALAAVGTGAALTGLIRTIRSVVDEAQRMMNAYQGLIQLSKSLNVNVEQSTDLVQELADKGFMSVTEAAEAVKTSLASGLNIEETRNLILSLADAAAYNRQAHYGWGEAVVTTLQGIKQGNSTLTDAVGVTTNLSVMYDRYAQSIGTTAGKLTEAQKIQAAYNGFLSEAAVYAGNADKAMEGYTGSQAKFNQTMQTARAELGEAYMPVLKELMDIITPLIKDFATWASNNKDVVAGLTAAAVSVGGVVTAITSLIAIIAVLRTAFIALNASMGPIGWVAAAIAAVTVGFVSYQVAANAASQSASEFAKSQEELNQALANSPINLSADQYTQMQENIEVLNDVLEKRNELEKEYNERLAAAQNGQGSIENTHRLFELADAIKAVDKELKGMGYDSAPEAASSLREMQQATKEATGALVELERQKMRDVIADVKSLEQMKALVAEYDNLNKQEELSAEQKTRLEQVTKSLKEQYPDLLVQLDEENRWHIKNKDALDQYISGEGNRVAAAGEASVRVLEIAKKEAEERVRLARENLAELERIENGGSKPTAIGNILPDGVKSMLSMGTESALKATKRELTETINQGQYDINEASKTIADIVGGNWDSILGLDGGDAPDESDKKKGKTLAQIQQEQYQAELKLIQYKKALNQMDEQEELKKLESLKKIYQKNADIRMDLEVKIYQLKEQIKNTSFKDFQESIGQEERRMTLAGKSEEEITRMKLDKWTTLRNRYQKDSELYKQADTQVYNARLSLMRMAEKAEEEAAKEREQRAKEVSRTAIDAIDKAKKAELDALDERRKAIQKFYDSQEEAIDDSERLKERNDLIAEMEKYRYATSEKGQKTFQDLQEKLRQMDVEDQKRNLKKQEQQELDALDQQKENIESWYDDLKDLLSEYSGDAIGIYKLIEDERFKAFVETNSKIKSELMSLAQSYASVMSGGSSAGGNASVVAQMQAISAQWPDATPEQRRQLEAENQRLGALIGATYKASEGRWYKDGMPLYHTGRDGFTGQNYRSGDRLMEDEFAAIIRNNEYVLTPEQIGSLFNSASVGDRARGNVYIDKLMEVNDPHFEDGIDLRAFGRETGGEASEILRKQLAGG